LGESGQHLVPRLVNTIVTDESCLTVETAGIALGVQGEDGLTELVPLTRHGSFVVRFAAYLGFEAAGSSARWVVPTLVRCLQLEWAPLNVDTILSALGKIGGPDALRCLASIAWDRRIDQETRRNCASALREAASSAPGLPNDDD